MDLKAISEGLLEVEEKLFKLRADLHDFARDVRKHCAEVERLQERHRELGEIREEGKQVRTP